MCARPTQMKATKCIGLTVSLAGVLLGSTWADQEKKVETPKKEAAKSSEGQWISLFNGKDLEGWTPKFVGYKAGENYKNTFRVVDGLLTVSYDQWEQFNSVFGDRKSTRLNSSHQ